MMIMMVMMMMMMNGRESRFLLEACQTTVCNKKMQNAGIMWLRERTSKVQLSYDV